MRKRIKNLFFILVRLTGLPCLFYRIFQNRRLTVIYYHSPSANVFEKHLRHLKRYYGITELRKCLGPEGLITLSGLPRYPLVITLDDGHASNYDLLPVLRKQDARATIFLTAGVCGTEKPFWFRSMHFSNAEKDLLKSVPNSKRLELLNQYEEGKPSLPGQALSWEEIREMHDVAAFQSHTLTHPCLPNCSDEEAQHEIAGSKEMIEEKTGREVYALCYPNGDFGKREKKLAGDAGYRCAFTGRHGFVREGDDPFALRRISINDDVDIHEFIARVTGVRGLLKRIGL